MLKMLLDPMGGIVLTNDGHAILREIEVAHPAAKSMIELSRTQVSLLQSRFVKWEREAAGLGTHHRWSHSTLWT